MSIASNLMAIQDQVHDAAARSGRSGADIRLVAVTKTVERDLIEAAYAAGVRHFGENRVQDMRRKFEVPISDDIVVHLVGHLQTNKARDAVRYSQIVESVDREDLVDALQRRCARESAHLDVLIQVNIAGEEQKFGCAPEDASALVQYADAQKNLTVRGLMTIAPLVDDAEAVRPVFRGLRELRDRISECYPEVDLSDLSMGMTNDYQVAIEEGATMIRLGRAIFEGQGKGDQLRRA
jgi:PLP dependent protein